MVTTRGSIQIQNIQKCFSGNDGNLLTVLDNVNVSIEGGSFCSIVGASGCGKTTLLRLIAGLETPTKGDISVDHEKIQGTHFERGLVFQNPRLFPWLNLYDNVAFGLRARNRFQEDKELVSELIELVGLQGFEKSYPHQLSGGMQQRAALARALVNHPKVLLLDEPLGALDSLTRENMQDELLKIWRARQTTMVMVTHDVEEAVYLSDQILVMMPKESCIKKTLHICLSRPRNRDSAEFTAIKHEILNILNMRKPAGEAG